MQLTQFTWKTVLSSHTTAPGSSLGAQLKRKLAPSKS